MVLLLGAAGALVMVPFEPAFGMTMFAMLISSYAASKNQTSRELHEDLKTAKRELEGWAKAAELIEDKQRCLAKEDLRLRRVRSATVGLGMLVAAMSAGVAFWYHRVRQNHRQAVEELIARWRPAAGQNAASPRAAGEEVPSDFQCVITGELFREPVVCADGHTYERAAIVDWFSRGYSTSPLTNQQLRSLELLPNHALRRAVEEF
eukprot:CAMPEP_0180779046 /NCGR_PEP_ID=MMETSP1038_2-20121128/46164_1 /TAXON_ID=632150 /ORGANISM="Azadinium spinosum, Strain 3D9" /LENGTH=205 /DNA_ID=CAMNT_0022814287 /DNA_START=24 /DNA_END=638 /DNA_ORIENTATION=+